MLDDAQRAFVERYHGVIYAVLSHEHLPASEYYDVGAERLCLAARSFKGNQDKFFSYAFTAVGRALRRAAGKRPHESDIDALQISGPDAFTEAEDRAYISDVLRTCKKFMTPKELQAMRNVLIGEKSHSQPEAMARDRALRKYKAYLNGEEIKTRPSEPLPPEQRIERNRKIIEMRAHGYGYKAVAFALNVSGRFVRQIYFEAGRPQYHTAADFARLLGVDRSTVLRHATARKEGRTWRIDEIHYRKKYPKFSKAYTEDEIEFIRSHPYWTAQEIAERIGRTACSVRIKKCRLKK